jgi:hypothetical protein
MLAKSWSKSQFLGRKYTVGVNSSILGQNGRVVFAAKGPVSDFFACFTTATADTVTP